MLSLSNISQEMGAFYYEKDDYYSRENSPAPSEFVGKGAEILGLKDFDKSIYKNLLLGLTPDGTTQLTYLKQMRLTKEEFNKYLEKVSVCCKTNGLSEGQYGEIKSLFEKRFKKQTIGPLEEQELLKEIKSFFTQNNFPRNCRIVLKKECLGMIKELRNNSRRAGYDLTFNAPKSVSLQVLINEDKRLLEAHKVAVKYALEMAEKRCIGVRIGGRNNREYQKTNNIIAATFPHGTSREGDPHLHTHVVLFNLTMRSDGKWRAIHNDEIYRQSRLIGLLYQNKLSEICQNLGYQIEIKSNGTFELCGFSKNQIEAFSKRNIQVRESSARILYEKDFATDLETQNFKFSYFEKFGKAYFKVEISKGDAKGLGFNVIGDQDGIVVTDGYSGRKSFESQKQKYISNVTQKLTRKGVLKSRAPKSNINYIDLAQDWKSQASEIQLPTLTTDKTSKKEWGKILDKAFPEKHLGERSSTWTILESETEALSINLGRADFRDIALLIKQNQDVIKTDIQPERKNETYELLTTIEHLSTEEKILFIAEKGQGKYSAIENEINLTGIKEEMGFTDGQVEMVKGVLTSKDFAVACLGVAGSGKSYAAKTIKDYIEKNGFLIKGLAPDATSAQALEKKSKIKSETIHRYLVKGQSKINPNTYEIRRRDFAIKLSRLGVSRQDLKKISLILTHEFSGTRYSPLNRRDLEKKIREIASFKRESSKIKFEKLLKEFFNGVSEKRTIIVVDEASKLSTNLMHKLMETAFKEGNRLVLLGDLRQTGAVEAGNPVRNLIKNEKILVFDLPETVRQKENSLMRLVVDSASKSTKEGLRKSIEQLGDKIITCPRKEARIAYAVKEYMKLYKKGERDILLLSDLNVDRHALTTQLREKLRESEFIGKKEIQLKVLVDRDLTAAQKACARYYEPGNFVVFHKDFGSCAANKIFEVSKIVGSKEKIELVAGSQKVELDASLIKNASVFKKDEISVSTGDILRWTKNHEGRINKNLVEVIKISKNTLTLKDQKTSEIHVLNQKDLSYLDYGLVMTVYSSQGHDREKGIFLAESNVSMNTWYTALSRMKKDVLVITDNKEKLFERISKSTTKLNALEFMEQKKWLDRKI